MNRWTYRGYYSNAFVAMAILLAVALCPWRAIAGDQGEALVNAAKEGGLDELQRLIEQGADVNYRDSKSGATALLWAASRGHTAVVKKLLASGADVHARSKTDETALIVSCFSKSGSEIARALLDKGARIDAKTKDGTTALMAACAAGDLGLVKFLLEKGADIKARKKDQQTVFFQACCGKGDTAVVKFLLHRGFDVNDTPKSGMTPLMCAAIGGRAELAKLLVARGADVNRKLHNGVTALALASWKGHSEVVRDLLAKNCDVDVPWNDLRLFEFAGRPGKRATEPMLKGVSAVADFWGGFTPLILASCGGHSSVVKLLLEKGASVNAKTGAKFTYAYGQGYYRGPAYDHLRGQTGTFEIEMSPLLCACAAGHVNVTKLLLDGGANPNESNKYGITPLAYASREGHENVVKLLKRHGATR